VVLNGFKGDKAVINAPARGTVRVSMEEFDRAFTGICLLITPGENFVPSGKRKSTIEFAASRLKGAGAAVAFVVLTSVISSLFGIINPVMTRIFMDRLLTGRNLSWLYPFIALMAALCVVQLVVQWIQVVYSLRINGKMSVVGSTSYMWKVLKLPMEFFSQRLAGDILQRESTNASIAGTLVETAAPLVLDTVMGVVYLTLMLRYSPILTLIGLTSVVMNLLIARYMSEKRVNLTRVQMRDAGKLASTTVAGISMAETIKASGAENGFFRKWSGYQASVNTQDVKYKRMNMSLGIIPSLISNVANYMVLFAGIFFTMNGNFTLGMISVFQGFLGSFMGPVSTLIGAGQLIQEMRTDMERVEDVMQYPEDPFVKDDPVSDEEDYSKLSGNVEVKNVTFGYSPLGEPVIKNFSMTLRPGSRVAIVGPSGC
jgi:ABC-type bacteriocin/lantibiotic exporter with double-glycine peptidase domain